MLRRWMMIWWFSIICYFPCFVNENQWLYTVTVKTWLMYHTSSAASIIICITMIVADFDLLCNYLYRDSTNCSLMYSMYIENIWISIYGKQPFCNWRLSVNILDIMLRVITTTIVLCYQYLNTKHVLCLFCFYKYFLGPYEFFNEALTTAICLIR